MNCDTLISCISCASHVVVPFPYSYRFQQPSTPHSFPMKLNVPLTYSKIENCHPLPLPLMYGCTAHPPPFFFFFSHPNYQLFQTYYILTCTCIRRVYMLNHVSGSFPIFRRFYQGWAPERTFVQLHFLQI
jgi:hypothetical protein